MTPVYALAVVLTLALGIGGTTAIFTLIHTVMLRSLPVSDPGRLYRIGDGSVCCEGGGFQHRWGMFSFPLYERLRAETPEFEEVAAFQAGPAKLSVRRQGVELVARPVRSEYVTGNYFATLGVGAFGGRVFRPEDDRLSAPPVACSAIAYGRRPTPAILRLWVPRSSWKAIPLPSSELRPWDFSAKPCKATLPIFGSQSSRNL